VSLNNEKICCDISEDKIAFCGKTAGLRRGKFSDSNSACLKVLVPVKIFQFQDMLNESERYQDAANGLEWKLGLNQLFLVQHWSTVRTPSFDGILPTCFKFLSRKMATKIMFA
jgi:hypothetical protein